MLCAQFYYIGDMRVDLYVCTASASGAPAGSCSPESRSSISSYAPRHTWRTLPSGNLLSIVLCPGQFWQPFQSGSKFEHSCDVDIEVWRKVSTPYYDDICIQSHNSVMYAKYDFLFYTKGTSNIGEVIIVSQNGLTAVAQGTTNISASFPVRCDSRQAPERSRVVGNDGRLRATRGTLRSPNTDRLAACHVKLPAGSIPAVLWKQPHFALWSYAGHTSLSQKKAGLWPATRSSPQGAKCGGQYWT